MDPLTVVCDAVRALDTMRREPTNFEAGVLETVLRQLGANRLPSPKQHQVLCEMIEKYLRDPALMRQMQAWHKETA